MRFDLIQIASITGGTLIPDRAAAIVTGVSTDSRSLRPGDLFVPLRGPRFDGHDYLVQAVRGGASACLSEEVVAGLPVPVVRVADTLRALGDLAAAVRQDFDGPVVAVTGSSGKTSTKEMLAGILGLRGPGLKTEGNFNNLIGLPHTLLRLEADHGWAVLELGMSARGEIARLAEISRPDVGIVTNVGPAHLETLLTLDGVARAKGELFAALPVGGTAVINGDDPRVLQLPVANGVRRLIFGCGSEAQVRAEGLTADGDGMRFDLLLDEKVWPVRLSVPGRYNVCNALAAAAAAHGLKVDGAQIVQGLENFRSCSGRMKVTELASGATLLEDYYNANPLAVEAALTVLDDLPGSGRRIAVLGDMLELGEAAAGLHRQTGLKASKCTDLLILLGQRAEDTAAGARQGGLPPQSVWVVKNHQEAVSLLQDLLRPGDRVLVKGSRGMTMEKICDGLRAKDGRPSAGH
ncbi:MAG: UDP-N-acetylmuramoyl-tripeptide--D-alanyl-D-alanine ligase [Syntrophotalea sp.]|jgi:UDP-N-acetylmuramoyl-tripeptide--D-alanyl-D-alanine ligase|uniref:UDP-N-acetylmuramoyl-tripeptide--D-alanyl-D- alanine ligase n=1 Tax=Syntrophotalea sp. TaxID=2812029 RepID=UPI003D1531BC